MTRWLSAVLAVVALVASAAVLQARDRRYPSQATAEDILYVSDGSTLAKVALGFDSLVADLYWIRAVQHYGRDRRSLSYEGRYRLLQPLIEVTTTLDPHFSTAYQFGALFLAEPLPGGAGRLDQGIALLEKGLRVDPQRWQYAQYLGFLHYWHGQDRAEAARQIERAAAMPGAPIWLKPLAAAMFIEGGEQQAARVIFEQLALSEERWIRDLAARRLQELGGR